MNNLPYNFLNNDSLTKANVRLLINFTYDMFSSSNEHDLMRQSLLGMLENIPLIWTLRHFFRECDHQGWDLAIVFAEHPYEFQNALNSGDMSGYYANCR